MTMNSRLQPRCPTLLAVSHIRIRGALQSAPGGHHRPGGAAGRGPGLSRLPDGGGATKRQYERHQRDRRPDLHALTMRSPAPLLSNKRMQRTAPQGKGALDSVQTEKSPQLMLRLLGRE